MTTLTITTRPAAGPARPAPSVADDPRWARIVARDKSADGQFWYSVATTGVYCRPSCPSRRANPRNVTLYDTLEGARASGFRPCRRCNPDGPSLACEQAALVARACRIIEASEEEPRLEELAGAVGRSPGYFHRIFKAATGLTPRLRGCRPHQEDPRGPRRAGQHHRSDLRCRLQFERPLLREIDRHARHDADTISRRRCR